ELRAAGFCRADRPHRGGGTGARNRRGGLERRAGFPPYCRRGRRLPGACRRRRPHSLGQRIQHCLGGSRHHRQPPRPAAGGEPRPPPAHRLPPPPHPGSPARRSAPPLARTGRPGGPAVNPGLLLHFVRQDLVDRHAGSALGALWTLLLPLANILIFTLVFSRIMGARLEMLGMESLGPYSYSVYLVTGLLAWNCFANTLIRITQVF